MNRAEFRWSLLTAVAAACLSAAAGQDGPTAPVSPPMPPRQVPSDEEEVIRSVRVVRAMGLADTLPSTGPASQPAGVRTVTIEDMDPETAKAILEAARESPEIREAILKRYPQLAPALEGQDANAAAPGRPAPPSTDAIRQAEANRRKADELVAALATAQEGELDGLESQLAALGVDAMIPLKRAALSDNFELRRRAARLAGRMRWRLVCPPGLLQQHPRLVEVMGDEEAAGRASLVDQVAASGDPAAMDFLGECLADWQTYVRQRAIEGLVALATSNSADSSRKGRAASFLELALGDDDRNIRLLAVGALAEVRAPPLARLAEMLDDESMEVRATVIRAMGHSRDAQAVQYVLPLLKDRQWRIRAAALEALAKLVDSDKAAPLGPAVLALLEDEDRYVRGLAAKTLSDWNYQAAAPVILKLLKDGGLAEEAAFRALGRLRDASGRQEALAMYDAATDPARKAELLSYMDPFDPDAAIDNRIQAALDEPAMQPQWPRLITLASRRQNSQRFFPLACRFLEHADAPARAAAWEFVKDHSTRQAIPEDIAERLLTSGDVQQAGNVLVAAYAYNGPWLPQAVRRALADPNARLAELALALVSHEHLSDSLGDARVPTYRRNRRGEIDYDTPSRASARPPLPADLKELIGGRLTDADPMVALRAAAVLYRSKARQDDAVRATLRAGLKSADLQLRLAAMAGIVEDAQPFLDDFDLPAAARKAETSYRALEIIANLGVPKYTDVLIEVASSRDRSDDRLMELLVLSGDERALAVVRSKLGGERSYMARYLAERLKGAGGPGAVKFVLWAMSQLGPSDRYERRDLIQVLASLTDPSAKDALQQTLKTTDWKAMDYYADEARAAIVFRLAELDPNAHMEGLRDLLLSEESQTRYSAIRMLTEGTPTPQKVRFLLEAARNPKAGSELEQAVWWLPADSLVGEFLPLLGELSRSFQEAALRRVGSELIDADPSLPARLSVPDPLLREHVSALVAVTTAEGPATRPAMDRVAEPSLPSVLAAVGDWDDAPTVLLPYLGDSRPAVAAGAARGLAYYVLGGGQGLTSAHRDALLAATRSSEAVTAYLAVEALALRWKDDLLKVDPNEVSSQAAAARLAVAHGADAPQAVRERVRGLLTGPAGATALQLAAVAASQMRDPSFLSAAERLAGQVPLQPLVQMASDANSERLARVLVSQGHRLSESQRKLLGPVIERLLAKARQGDGPLFGALANAGWIDPSRPGDLGLLVQFAPYLERDDYGDGWSSVGLAMALAGDQPDVEIAKQASPTSTGGVLAAAVAAIRWRQPEARDILLQAATTQPASRGSSRAVQRQRTAMAALSLCATAREANALLAAAEKLDREDYDLRQLKMEMIREAAWFVPRPALEAMARDQQLSGYRFPTGVSAGEILVLIADEPNLPTVQESEHFSSNRESPDLLPALRAARAAGAASAPAGTPAPQSGAAAAVLAPPWGADRSPPDRTAEQARRRLAQILTAIQSGEPDGDGDGDDSLEDWAPFTPPGPFVRKVMLGGASYDDWRPPGLRNTAQTADGPPEEFSLEHVPDAATSALAVLLPAKELADALRPLLASESPAVRQAAMRHALIWQTDSLAEEVGKLLGSDGEEAVEAAWTLAGLKGPAAAAAIAEARARQKSFDARVRLACLLRLLGSDGGAEDIRRAVSLRTIRQFRMKFILAGSSSYDDYEYRSFPPRDRAARGGVDIYGRLFACDRALWAAAGDLVRAAGAPFPTLALEHGWDVPSPAAPEPPRSDLSGLSLSPGLLSAPGLATNDLPLEPLSCQTPYWAPLFASLCAAEQGLEAHFYVQFADQASSAMELRDRWVAWWRANKDRSRADWWLAGLGQAVEELTHARWWHRMRGARRLERLTGARVDPPGVFDLPAWRELQRRWRGRLEQARADGPRVTLLRAGVEAGILSDAGPGRAGSDEAFLTDLTRLAGFAPAHLSQAALLHLETWGDPPQLARASLPWQHCPRRELTHWTQARLGALTGTTRLIYTPQDLTQPPGQPASGPGRP